MSTITIDKPETIDDYIANINKKTLILHNDDHNSFEHVINCLINLCDHEALQAEQCATIVHNNGKCPVKSGNEDYIIILKKAMQMQGLSVTVD